MFLSQWFFGVLIFGIQYINSFSKQTVKVEYTQGIFWKFRAAFDIGQKENFFMKKRGLFLKKRPQKFLSALYSISFLSVLHHNKALLNFHKRGQRWIVERSIGLEYALILCVNFLCSIYSCVKVHICLRVFLCNLLSKFHSKYFALDKSG